MTIRYSALSLLSPNQTWETFSGHRNWDGTNVDYTSADGHIYRLAGEDGPQITNGTNASGQTIAIYDAIGYDQQGMEYRLRWEITNPETDEASEACNWDEFEAIPTGEVAPWHPQTLIARLDA